ncbi:uncharacterized protein LOC107272408 isoform X2 [Cephus cinctus]|uniref:Uncharacterized protein LOC107272408 isoform X2 n=1 Tax=Cephus cinctus TaxID=211228 RepID=A0AAJ7CA78_CEPCN|nr:uncharacterized protein LOC107272408 isoform X2 [Cephus cinctus]
MNPTAVRQWLQRGELEKLENVVVEGRGARLLGEHSPDLRTRVFLKGLPNYLTKIAQIHDAVIRGSLSEIQRIISEEPKKKLAIAKDPSGTPLIHKAVYYDHQNIIEWLVKNYPVTTQQKDKEGRIALHYCAACRDPSAVWDVLIEAGCDASICDKRGNPSAYYLKNTSEIELPEAESMAHRKASSGRENLDFKPSNIRIWIHNRDIGKLQQVLWEGHGSKLRCETSNNPRVKKFLEAVPFIMGTIKSVHTATVKNDLEAFRDKIADPVSPVILCSKDSNGLNVLHKAAGLGYLEIAREILERYPAAVLAQDSEGKTPLHYAAAVKDSGVMYDLLVGYGADESKLDNRQKAPAFYKNRPSDVDVTNLVVIPEAPRVSGTNYPKNWDWRILEAEEGLRGTKKVFNNVDLDSAFGTAEAATKVMNGAKKILANDHKEDPKDDLVERIKLADAELEKKRAALSEKAEAKEEPEAEQEKDVTEEEDEEGKSSDDDVVVTTSEITEGNTENNNTNVEVNADDYSTSENLLGEQTNPENKEKSDPSTGDSGVDDPGNEEDQVIVGEHEELPEAELNEGSMAVDPEVEDLVENGNMEQLAALVLNGEGRRLVGRHSSNPELQAFIDNVPAYMGKIHAVHIAAREGDLRDLQSALDRRKFAIARDASSPHGATPLHAAVIFGHTSIIRYLAGRFPETAHAIDLDGRTPLHYAATLADNGHYYNLLLHLGANPLVQDNFEQKAEFYKHNQKDLSHKKLLRDFGARENIADEMLTDKVPGEDVYSARRDVTEPETLATLERCYRLLAGARRGSVPNTPGTASTLLGRCLKRPVFDKIKHRVTRMDHNLFDVIWPALKKYSNATNVNYSNHSLRQTGNDDDCADGNVVAPDYESYMVFAELFDPLIRDLHRVTTTGDLPEQPAPHFFDTEKQDESENSIEEAISVIESYDLDPSGKYVLAGVMECCRNLECYSLPLTLTINQLEETEREITNELLSAELSVIMAEGSSEDEGGTYYTLNEVLDKPSEVRARLAAAGLLLPLTENESSDDRRLHGKFWPYGRGVFVAATGDLAAWINVQDHLRVICCTNEHRPGQIGKAYVRLAKVITALDNKLLFKRDTKLGFLSARLCSVGNTLRFNFIIKFPELSKEPDNLRHLCVVRGLRIKETMRRDIVKIGNQQCLLITELQTLQDFSRAVLNILTLEKEVSLNNSMRIATLIAGIFRKRLSSSRSIQNQISN